MLFLHDLGVEAVVVLIWSVRRLRGGRGGEARLTKWRMMRSSLSRGTPGAASSWAILARTWAGGGWEPAFQKPPTAVDCVLCTAASGSARVAAGASSGRRPYGSEGEGGPTTAQATVQAGMVHRLTLLRT